MPFEQYVLVPVITNQWYKIELEQAGTANENQAVFNVTINGLIVGSHQTQFAQYKRVKFYSNELRSSVTLEGLINNSATRWRHERDINSKHFFDFEFDFD